MAFFKKLAKDIEKVGQQAINAIEDSALIPQLDKINAQCLEQFEVELRNVVSETSRIINTEEIAEREQSKVDLILQAYDHDACPIVGRPVNENWRDVPGEVIEVRKRMLNRELEKRRGSLQKMFLADLRYAAYLFEDEQITVARKSKEDLQHSYPLPINEAEERIASIRRHAENHVNLAYGDMAGFDNKLIRSNLLAEVLNVVAIDIRHDNKIATTKYFQDSLSRIEEFERFLTDRLPRRNDQVNEELNAFQTQLKADITNRYSPGVSALESISGLSFDNRVEDSRGRLLEENKRRIGGLLQRYQDNLALGEKRISESVIPASKAQLDEALQAARIELEDQIGLEFSESGGFGAFDECVGYAVTIEWTRMVSALRHANATALQRIAQKHLDTIRKAEADVIALIPKHPDQFKAELDSLLFVPAREAVVADFPAGLYDLEIALGQAEISEALVSAAARLSARNEEELETVCCAVKDRSAQTLLEAVRTAMKEVLEREKSTLAAAQQEQGLLPEDKISSVLVGLDNLASKYLDAVNQA